MAEHNYWLWKTFNLLVTAALNINFICKYKINKSVHYNQFFNYGNNTQLTTFI